MNADDVAAFTIAMRGQYRVPAGDIGEYRFLYRGYWYDRHLNIYHVRHRAYDPRIQRWLQPDPAMFVDGLNRYAYCRNRPLSLYDPMGLAGWGVFNGWGTTLGYMFGGGPDGAAGHVWTDFGRGAHDGGKVTSSIIIHYLTFGALGRTRQELAARGALFDPENEWLAASTVAGHVSGGALLAAGSMWIGGMAAGGNTVAWYTNAGLQVINVGQGLYSVGNGVYLAFQGDYWGAVGSILGGGLQIFGGFEGFRIAGGKPIRLTTPDGRAYSVAIRIELAPTSYPGVPRYKHNQEANETLYRMASTDSDLAKYLTTLGVRVSVPGPKGSFSTKPPPGWTWHHSGDTGILELVPRHQHTPGSMWWDTMHPDGTGRYCPWGKFP